MRVDGEHGFMDPRPVFSGIMQYAACVANRSESVEKFADAGR